jgi:hypothetical protein
MCGQPVIKSYNKGRKESHKNKGAHRNAGKSSAQSGVQYFAMFSNLPNFIVSERHFWRLIEQLFPRASDQHVSNVCLRET